MKVRNRALSNTPAIPTTRVLGEAGDPEGRLRHGVQWIGHHNNDAIRRVFRHLLGGGAHDVVVGDQQIVATHARFARKSRGDDGEVGVRRGRIVVGARDHHVISLNRPGFQEIEAFTLWNTVHNVHQHYVCEFLIGNPQSAIRADIPGAHDCDFFRKANSFCFWRNCTSIISTEGARWPAPIAILRIAMRRLLLFLFLAMPLFAQSIRFAEDRKVFLLTTSQNSYAMGIAADGSLRHIYWGAPLWNLADLPALAPGTELSSFDPGR